MDALKLLKEDHEKVDELFDAFEKSTDRAQKKRRLLVDKICHELTVHAAIEEKIFYPAVRRADEEIGDMILEAFEEHAIVKQLVAQLKSMSETDERFAPKTKVLTELVRHHVKEEEKDLFPKVKKVMSAEEREVLGEQLEQAKLRVQKAEAEALDRRPRSNGNGQSASVR